MLVLRNQKTKNKNEAGPEIWNMTWHSQLHHVILLLDMGHVTEHQSQTGSLWDSEKGRENKATS